MKLLYCHNSIVPIDKIASVFIAKAGGGIAILVKDVSGHNHTYHSGCDDMVAARASLFNLAAWLKAGAPEDREP